MSEPMAWWANRKSQLGLRPLAKTPPHLPGGKPWWTEPPTAMPPPEHIEYVAQFIAELYADARNGRSKQAMMKYCADWMKGARRLLHQEYAAYKGGLTSTDDLIVAVYGMLHAITSHAIKNGYVMTARDEEVKGALMGKADEIRKRIALERSRTARLTTTAHQPGSEE